MNIVTFKQLYSSTNNQSGIKMINLIEKITYHFKISINKAIGFLLTVTTYKPDIKILNRIGEIYHPDFNIPSQMAKNMDIALKSNFRNIVRDNTDPIPVIFKNVETTKSVEELSNILTKPTVPHIVEKPVEPIVEETITPTIETEKIEKKVRKSKKSKNIERK